MHGVLKWFSQVSYYNLNVKTPLDLQALISRRFTYRWTEDRITYLGMPVPTRTKDLYSHNYMPWLAKLPVELNGLTKHEMAVTDRINAFKMMILPRLLYIFRTVPILVSKQYFHKLQARVTKFLCLH